MNEYVVICVMAFQMIVSCYILITLRIINQRHADLTDALENTKYVVYYLKKCSIISMFALRAKMVESLQNAVLAEKYEDADYFKTVINEIDKTLEVCDK